VPRPNQTTGSSCPHVVSALRRRSVRARRPPAAGACATLALAPSATVWTSERVGLTSRPAVLALRQTRAMADAAGPVARRIRDKLQRAFEPAHLDVLNESYMHNVPKGAETHFKVGAPASDRSI
jgi:hypothetical protein